MPGKAVGTRLTIGQLAEQSGVKVPTIHHYRKLGLLPELVRVDAHRFGYDQQHLHALRLIRLLRDRRRLPLKRIGEVLPGLLAADEEAFRPEMWDELVAEPLKADDGEHVHDALVAQARQAFNDRGFASVSVEQLCDVVGVAKGSFYRFFASKREAFVAAVASVGDLAERAATEGDRRTAAVGFDRAVGPFVPLVLEASVRALHGDAACATASSSLLDRLVTTAATWRRGKATTAADQAAGREIVANTVQQRLEMGLARVIGLMPAASPEGA